MVRPSLNNIVEYELYHKDYGIQPIPEVKGWETIDEEYARDKKDYSITTKYTTNNAFIGSAVKFIDEVYEKYGINAKIKSIRRDRNPKTNEWHETFNQTLKSLSYTKENGEIKIGSYPSELEEKIKAFQNERFELDRLESVNGIELDPLETKLLQLKGREIFLYTEFGLDEDNKDILNIPVSMGLPYEARAVPLKIISQSDEHIHSVTNLDVPEDSASYDQGSVGNVFYLDNDREKVFKLNLDVAFTHQSGGEHIVRLDLVTYENGNDLDYKSHTTLKTSNQGTSGTFTHQEEINVDFLLPGESLGLIVHMIGSANINLNYTKAAVTIQENSFFNPSQTKVLLGHEIGERLCQIMTGEKGLFYSEAFGRTDLGYKEDGEWAYIAFTSGFWIRLFNEKTFKISFKEFKSFFQACLGMSFDYQVINGKERMVVEPFKYFFQDFIGVRLPYEIANVKQKYVFDKYYNAIEIGSNEGGTYEDIMGLTEYNSKSNWTIPLDIDENKYSALSDVRRDSYEIERIRRKPKETHPNEDTRSDDSAFAIHAKKGVTNVLEERYWQDDLDKAPTGIFSPETATNLMLSDARCMLRHGIFLRAGLTKNLTDSISFSSSVGNSEMITEKGGVELVENGKILASSLDKEAFIPKEKSFEHVVDFNLLQQINGTTNVNGREVPNLYGLIEYVENGKKKYGRHWSIKPRGKGSFTILETE